MGRLASGNINGTNFDKDGFGGYYVLDEHKYFLKDMIQTTRHLNFRLIYEITRIFSTYGNYRYTHIQNHLEQEGVNKTDNELILGMSLSW